MFHNCSALTRLPAASYRILKRRIGWVLGKSAPEEELAPGMEPAAKIWELLSILLQDQSESSDVAVRLSAALAIRERVDVSGDLATKYMPAQ